MGGRQGIHRAGALLAVLLVTALVCVTAASCGSTSGEVDKASPTPKQGGTYNYPLSADYFAFDPVVLHQVCEGLVRYDERPDGTLKTVPCLAESWSPNADATVWTFRLRQGVKFQAPVSREVTAADVVAALRFTAAESPWTYLLEPLKGMVLDESTGAYVCPDPKRLGVAAVNRYTVRFTLKYPFSEFPDTTGTAAYWVYPVDYVREIDFEHLVGTGPYRFLGLIPGKSIDLVRNHDWWDTSGGPYIDTIHFEVFSSVPSMMHAFQMGRIDWTKVPKGQVDASRSLPQVKSGQWTTESTPEISVRYLCFNMKDPVVGGTKGLQLRQMLSYACDRQALIDVASDGTNLPASGIVPPGVPGSGVAKEPYLYDPAKAQELAKQIGPLTLEFIYHTTSVAWSRVAETLAADYAKIGITLRVRGLKWDDFWARMAAGEYQMSLPGWMADYPSMDTFLYMFQSHNSGALAASMCTFYSNPRVDALLAQARASTSEESRLQLYTEAERLIMADAPVVPIWVDADYRLYNNRVANVRFNSMAWVDLWRAWVK